MQACRDLLRGRLWYGCLAGLMSFLIATRGRAQTAPQAIAVPSFFPLVSNYNGVTPDWIRIYNAGAVAKIVVAPDPSTLGNGSGSPTDCNGSPTQMFDCLRSNGQLVLGYVDTSAGKRDGACASTNPNCNVVQGLDGGLSVNGWYQRYTDARGVHIDGIFLDNGPAVGSGSNTQAYYQNLYSAIRSAYAGKCNGRACILLNASQFEDDWVVNGPASDFAIMYERPVDGADNNGGCGNPDNQDYFGASTTYPLGFCPNFASGGPCVATQSPAGWYRLASNSSKIGHVLRKPRQVAVLSNSDLDRIIAQGRSAYGSPGLFYVHDEACLANGAQYTHLSPYFEYLANAFGSSLAITKSGQGSGTVTSTPEGISCGPTCVNHLSTGAQVTLMATPSSNSTFGGFVINGTTNCSSPCSFTLSGSTSVTANFTVPDFALSVNPAVVHAYAPNSSFGSYSWFYAEPNGAFRGHPASAQTTLSATALYGSTQSISLSASSFPGVSILAGATLIAGASEPATCDASNASPGTYNLTVTGTASGSPNHSTGLTCVACVPTCPLVPCTIEWDPNANAYWHACPVIQCGLADGCGGVCPTFQCQVDPSVSGGVLACTESAQECNHVNSP